MFFDAPGQSCLPHKSGTIEFSAEYHARRKPVWLVLLKILGSLAMIAVAAVIAIPSLVELEYPLWQAIAITVGGMAVSSANCSSGIPSRQRAKDQWPLGWRARLPGVCRRRTRPEFFLWPIGRPPPT